MKKLSIVDDAFLRIESRRQPFHIGMLMLFEPGMDTPVNFIEKLVQKLKSSTEASEPFNRQLVTKRGIQYWKEDTDFDITQQFAHISLPKPGRIRELLEFVSRVHSSHLDRAYPLWRLYLIEGLEDGRFAVFLKFHHSMMDGVAGLRVMVNAMSGDIRESENLPAFWQSRVDKSEAHRLPSLKPFAVNLKSLRSLPKQSFQFIKPLYRDVNRSILDYLKSNPNAVFFGQAPRSIFNQKVSASRRYAAQSYSTARMRAIAQRLDATLNDVVLALCGSALRIYLKDRNELPDTPLVAAIPVSIREQGDNSLNNEVAFTLTHLGTHIADPVRRLQSIKNCMDYNKKNLRELSPGQTLASAVMKLVPGAVNAVLGLKPDNALASICISHVPGPREALYWQGARLSGLYPVSLVTDTGAVNITIISRHDYVDFGIIACSKTVPSMQRLIDYLEDGLIELEQALLPPSVDGFSAELHDPERSLVTGKVERKDVCFEEITD
ncbi:WS/DGAT/MGAT family O-acyltransferase [Ketobacter nezhaii]|uniref:WS/DGAT/MGAT family O-acyltransferase n=1 Tax=Ketobacter sp. MCCC 1A13808 TaxID=2602738 RepID=UPI0018DC4972|nr:wax ester/triacylglycerol synthase family O-acyltransferase [Ketobacter sp. MCCC 1A13808]